MAPRPPDWLLYLGVVAALLIASLRLAAHADAPRPPPPPPFADQAPISPSSPFANVALMRARAATANRGTAFSVGGSGVWLTARQVVEGCAKPAIVVADGWTAPARIVSVSGDVAVLATGAGAPVLNLARLTPPQSGDGAFMPGFSRGGGPGEVAAVYLGPEPGRARLAWAEIGRTEGLAGPLFGMAGAPMLNASGDVAGMALGDNPRRGQVSAAPPEALIRALASAKLRPGVAQPGQPITLDNYGRAADALRRDLSVVEVICGPG